MSKDLTVKRNLESLGYQPKGHVQNDVMGSAYTVDFGKAESPVLTEARIRKMELAAIKISTLCVWDKLYSLFLQFVICCSEGSEADWARKELANLGEKGLRNFVT